MTTGKAESTHPNAAAFPSGLSGPALRALANAGIRSMADLVRWREEDLAELHGMGPKALSQLKEGLAERGAGLRDSSDRRPEESRSTTTVSTHMGRKS